MSQHGNVMNDCKSDRTVRDKQETSQEFALLNEQAKESIQLQLNISGCYNYIKRQGFCHFEPPMSFNNTIQLLF